MPGRYFRSRGFGVHSPFAFRFINDVLRMRGYGLYCYPAVNELPLPDGARLSHATLRLWARLASFFNPSDVSASGVGSSAALATAALVCPSAAVRPSGSAALIWLGDEHPDPARLAEEICGREATLLLHRCRVTADALRTLLPYGMTFTNRSGLTIVVASDRLPRQDFKLYF